MERWEAGKWPYLLFFSLKTIEANQPCPTPCEKYERNNKQASGEGRFNWIFKQIFIHLFRKTGSIWTWISVIFKLKLIQETKLDFRISNCRLNEWAINSIINEKLWSINFIKCWKYRWSKSSFLSTILCLFPIIGKWIILIVIFVVICTLMIICG